MCCVILEVSMQKKCKNQPFLLYEFSYLIHCAFYGENYRQKQYMCTLFVWCNILVVLTFGWGVFSQKKCALEPT